MGPRFSAALALASDLHRFQQRKDKELPYIAHLLAVSALVLEHGGDEDTAIAALLHDAVEDQGGKPTRERIRSQFGSNVVDVIVACSDTDVVPKPPWRERKEAYIAAIPHKSGAARFVSLADKVHNAREILDDYRQIGEALWARFNGGREGTLWYYRALANGLREGTPPRLWQLLEDAVAELETLTGTQPSSS